MTRRTIDTEPPKNAEKQEASPGSIALQIVAANART